MVYLLVPTYLYSTHHRLSFGTYLLVQYNTYLQVINNIASDIIYVIHDIYHINIKFFSAYNINRLKLKNLIKKLTVNFYN